MDLDLLRMVHAEVSIPVVAHGGVGRAEDMVTVFKQTGVDAICAASVYHYDTITRIDTQALSVRGNTSFVNSGSIKKNLLPTSIYAAKEVLRRNGVNVR
jgi:cyclase